MSVQLSFRLANEDLAKLRAYAEREGIKSLHLAARSLILGAIDEFPKWGVQRGAVEAWLNVARGKFLVAIGDTTRRIEAEVEAEMAIQQNAEAVIEKGQVTFSREDQE